MLVDLILWPVFNLAYPGLGVVVLVQVMSLLINLVPVILDVLHVVPQELLRLFEFHQCSDVRPIELREES